MLINDLEYAISWFYDIMLVEYNCGFMWHSFFSLQSGICIDGIHIDLCNAQRHDTVPVQGLGSILPTNFLV